MFSNPASELFGIYVKVHGHVMCINGQLPARYYIANNLAFRVNGNRLPRGECRRIVEAIDARNKLDFSFNR
jgi:hypothetical protein